MSKRLTEADVTPKEVFINRRQFVTGVATSLGAISASSALTLPDESAPRIQQNPPDWLSTRVSSANSTEYGSSEKLTPYGTVTRYNNFYEFGMDKTDPAKTAHRLKTDDWTVRVSGLCKNIGEFDLETLTKGLDVEERIYRFRCVEAWSMVIPWVGFQLSSLIAKLQPLGSAKFIEFETLLDPEQMPEQGNVFSTIDWPYREGLRLDEASHPLTFMAIGLYGEPLPKQNGAPWRLVVPWKYGFKSIKSIVGIKFTDTMPQTTWNQLAPNEYGFYANVNPDVDHPRWSQASEKRLPSGLFAVNRIPTQPFNGYAEDVAHLYRGMDLKKYF